MTILRRFLRHEGGSSFESLALALSVIAVLCVAGADLLHYASRRDGALTRFALGLRAQFAQANARDVPLRTGIDYTPTGTIIGLRRAATAINPCTAAPQK